MGNYEIDTIFYFCPNEQTYASQKNSISPRTIVFVEDSKKIYKNQICYGSNMSEDDIKNIIQNLITNNEIEGIAGANGKDGKSAYDLAKENGFTGTLADWLDSLHGSDGQDGQDY